MEKDFDRWNKKKKVLNKADFIDYVHEREVWWCALGVNVGVEADGKHDNFERPVLVLRKFSRDAVLVVPLTSRVKRNRYYAPFMHGGNMFAAVISQMRPREHQAPVEEAVPDGQQDFCRYPEDSAGNDWEMKRNRPPLARGPHCPGSPAAGGLARCVRRPCAGLCGDRTATVRSSGQQKSPGPKPGALFQPVRIRTDS
jgi:mRNA interferase MazF